MQCNYNLGTTLKKGTRVICGPSWDTDMYGDCEPEEEGIVLEDTEWGFFVKVKWEEEKEEEGDGAEGDESDVFEYRWGVDEDGEDRVDVWDLASGQITQTLEGHEDYVRCVTFSPDGSQLASASSDKTVKVI